MKPLRLTLSVLLIAFANLALAQSEETKAFDKLKALAGSWEGPATSDVKAFNADSVHVVLRVTSMGNALLHELSSPGQPQNPITMLYLEGDRLQLTHFCDMGNRPRMQGTVSPDGKTVAFDFVDVTGSTKHGYMNHVTFTFIDPSHHTEDWTAVFPGDKIVRTHIDLQRTK
jgi:hypothetical protein